MREFFLVFLSVVTFLMIFFLILWFKEKKKVSLLTDEKINMTVAYQSALAQLAAFERLFQEQKQQKLEFKALAEETLESTQSKWLSYAEKQFKEIHQGVQHDLEKKEIAFSHLVNPMKETLNKLDEKLALYQKEKHATDEVFKTNLEKMAQLEIELMKETKALVAALKNSSVRGFWGEITLKRMVELAGLINHCDFFEQQKVGDEESLRPDLVIQLPNQRHLVVDAKVPLGAYLQAMESADEHKKGEFIEKHAKQIRTHVQLLSKKSYFEKFSLSPEFVIMFLPVDQIYQIALEVDPTLIEYSAQLGVIIATPMSLIGLLKSIHYAWKQEAISINAKAISEMGEELSKAVSVMLEHMEKLGKSITASVQSFNQVIGSAESRLMPKAQKLRQLIGKEEQVEVLAPIEKMIRNIEVASAQD